MSAKRFCTDTAVETMGSFPTATSATVEKQPIESPRTVLHHRIRVTTNESLLIGPLQALPSASFDCLNPRLAIRSQYFHFPPFLFLCVSTCLSHSPPPPFPLFHSRSAVFPPERSTRLLLLYSCSAIKKRTDFIARSGRIVLE